MSAGVSGGGRALHFVLKIGNRRANYDFFTNVLGMKILRHEEFEEGCKAACNGPYDGKWSKTMVGYGPEDDHFVVELTYNYSVRDYKVGNDFQGLTISDDSILDRVLKVDYPKSEFSNNMSGDGFCLLSPDGYKFYVTNNTSSTFKNKDAGAVKTCSLAVSNLETSLKYWKDFLQMTLVNNGSDDKKEALLSYSEQSQCYLRLVQLEEGESIEHATAYGRIAYSIPEDQVEPMEVKSKENNYTVLTPFVSLDTPGKATVRVVILADPWATPGFGRPDVLLNDDTTSCLETRIEWYAVTQERNWINPHDPSALESALEQRRPASTIPNVVIERDGRLLTIFTDVDDHYHNTRNFYERDNERKKSWRQLERDLIKITGIYWCEFQYCYEKQMQYQRAHAVVKYPIRMDSENMERQITGYIDDDVILECLVIGGPYYTIKWGRGNKTLSLNSAQLTRSRERGDKVRYFQFYRDPKTGQPTKLILKGVQYFDRAEYFCNATSFDGNEISASFMLRVKDRFTSYIPLGVIVGQVLLIFLLVFLTEKFFVHRSHDRLPKHNERFSALKAMEMTNTQPRRNLNDDLKYATVSGTLDRKQDTANYNTYQSAGNAII